MDKLICIGKNYALHARELGDAVPEKPVIFLKAPSVLLTAPAGGRVQARLPRGRGSIHHECEIVALVGPEGGIDAVTLGLDMTLRDIQTQLKKSGHPWEISKVFAGSAILGPWIPLGEFPEFLETPFSFSLDGALRQQGRGADMLFPPERCLAHAREFFPVLAGDALFTGTPAGVGPVGPGQLGELRWGEKIRFQVQWL